MLTKAQYVKRHSALKHTGTSKVNHVALAKASEILDALKADLGKSLTHVWGYDPNKSNTEHYSGRAFDFMVFNDKKAGDFIAQYVIDNKDRLGLIHVIWRQRIWRGPKSTSKNPKGKWQKMADRGNSTQNHMDHPHIWFAAESTYKEPSTVVAKGVPQLSVQLERGARSGQVTLLQQMLNGLQGSKLVVDGSFGALTEQAVISAARDWKVSPPLQIVGPGFRAQANARYSTLINRLAKEVIKGKWGNQPEREKRLKNSGYDYNTIQNRVRELL